MGWLSFRVSPAETRLTVYCWLRSCINKCNPSCLGVFCYSHPKWNTMFTFFFSSGWVGLLSGFPIRNQVDSLLLVASNWWACFCAQTLIARDPVITFERRSDSNNNTYIKKLSGLSALPLLHCRERTANPKSELWRHVGSSITISHKTKSICHVLAVFVLLRFYDLWAWFTSLPSRN